MFEEKTFDNLMRKAMSYAPEWADTSEGSVFYDVAGPLCMLLTEAYIDLQLLQEQVKLSSATGSWLDDKAEEYGIKREQSTPWIYRLVYEGATISIGERFFAEGYYYFVSAMDEDGNLYIECETAGLSVPKLPVGTAVVPVYTIEGLTKAQVGEVFRYATDTETDDELRARLQETLAQPSENANVAQVINWATEFEGVNNVKVYGRSTYSPERDVITKGVPNNVAIFIGAEKGYTESDVVRDFQKYIDPDMEGYGEGVGIIGTIYAVYALVPVDIIIDCTVHLKTSVYGFSADVDEIKSMICERLTGYFSELVDNADGEYLYIYNDNVKAELQELEGFTSCENLTMGGSSKNLKIPSYKRPVISKDNITVEIVMEDTDNDFEEL